MNESNIDKIEKLLDTNFMFKLASLKENDALPDSHPMKEHLLFANRVSLLDDGLRMGRALYMILDIIADADIFGNSADYPYE